MVNPSLDGAEQAIEAMTSAIEAASEVIEGLEDPDEAFRLATVLWQRLRAATDANGQLRARLAGRIWEVHKLDLAALANRLSTPNHPVGRSRAGQLVQSAQKQREEQHGDGVHEDLGGSDPGGGH